MALVRALDTVHGEVQETPAVGSSSEQREGRDGETGSRMQPERGLPVPRACGQSSRGAPAGTGWVRRSHWPRTASRRRRRLLALALPIPECVSGAHSSPAL